MYKTENIVGLFAGSGNLPLVFSRNVKEKIIAVGIEGITSERLKDVVNEFHFLQLDNIDRWFDFFQKKNVSHLVMLGKFDKDLLFRYSDNFQSFKKILSRVGDGQDLSFFQLLCKEAGRRGIRIVKPSVYLSHLLANEGQLTKKSPAERELRDANFGWKIAKRMAELDIGQTVVIKNLTVLAVEALEGTDATIIRGGVLGGEGTVVVKVARPNQDMRFDVPVVGPATIENMARIKSSLLAVEKEKVILLHKSKIVRIADRSKISIFGLGGYDE